MGVIAPRAVLALADHIDRIDRTENAEFDDIDLEALRAEVGAEEAAPARDPAHQALVEELYAASGRVEAVYADDFTAEAVAARRAAPAPAPAPAPAAGRVLVLAGRRPAAGAAPRVEGVAA
ncbi:hypothetical protein [Nocardiopsis composta]|uniref:Uncharacterized protein n=1 Tax=Nocardiopsis composta TaxID=157465 RepID=A0A7W8VHQ5_9ACTN|nr:hypothetical protein [Nocardiopsis composta]MBB5436299.1 hypothetical protein [Nocardiopsis composta]